MGKSNFWWKFRSKIKLFWSQFWRKNQSSLIEILAKKIDLVRSKCCGTNLAENFGVKIDVFTSKFWPKIVFFENFFIEILGTKMQKDRVCPSELTENYFNLCFKFQVSESRLQCASFSLTAHCSRTFLIFWVVDSRRFFCISRINFKVSRAWWGRNSLIMWWMWIN